MSKNVLIIVGHPDKDTYNGQLASAYHEGYTKTDNQVERLDLGDLKFDPVLWKGYKVVQELEPDLAMAWKKVEWADHLVFVYPTWWGTMPALLKGFIDRIFLPGKAYNTRKGGLPIQHLKGKTARLIVTMDGPSWFYRWFTRAPGHHQMQKAILGFCGIKPVKITEVPLLKHMPEKKRNHYLKKVEQLGQQIA